ncbi:MAG: toxin-activating lysine-acyltransferase [Methylocystaceae bacterium]|nr:toxin-activating lysine-acyltransferase [Methylocystaceae bacterium]
MQNSTMKNNEETMCENRINQAEKEANNMPNSKRTNVATLFGVITALMMDSPLHNKMSLVNLDWLVMGAIKANQYRVFRKEGVPVAFASWAFLSDERSKAFEKGEYILSGDEWNSGDNLWLVDLVAPYGGNEEIIEEIKESIFPDRTMMVLAPSSEKEGYIRLEW